MQKLLNVESDDIKEECFWFRGINYHTKVFTPEKVIEMIKKIRPQLSRLLTAVKIGESGGDLVKFRKKMLNLLTYLAGAILVSNGVLIPVASCRSRTLEQSRHFLELRNRIEGELHGDIDMDEKANDARSRVGGMMFRTTTKLAGRDLSPSQNDVTGELYAWKVAWDEGDLKALKSIFSQLDNDRQVRVTLSGC